MLNVLTETLQFKFTDFCTDKIYHTEFQQKIMQRHEFTIMST